MDGSSGLLWVKYRGDGRADRAPGLFMTGGDDWAMSPTGDGQTAEVAELHQLRGLGVSGPQRFHCLVDCEQIIDAIHRGRPDRVQVQAASTATALVGLLAPGDVDEDAAHGLRRGRKKCPRPLNSGAGSPSINRK